MLFFHYSETNDQKNPQFHFSNQNLSLSTVFGKINLTIINETNQDQSGSRVGMVDLSKKNDNIFQGNARWSNFLATIDQHYFYAKLVCTACAQFTEISKIAQIWVYEYMSKAKNYLCWSAKYKNFALVVDFSSLHLRPACTDVQMISNHSLLLGRWCQTRCKYSASCEQQTFVRIVKTLCLI